jgi:hypothetical protein
MLSIRMLEFSKIIKKFRIKMQISTVKNSNFDKPFRNPSNRTQVSILKKKFFEYLSKKIWFRVCSVTAKMFELRNSGENRRKRSDIFFENLPREYKDLILVQKKFKIISCLCTFKEDDSSEMSGLYHHGYNHFTGSKLDAKI